MKVEAAFIFVAPDADMNVHSHTIKTPVINLHVTGVKDYEEGVLAARSMAAKGVRVIELCGGFGNAGTATIAQAVGPDVKVGTVKFDCHPGLEFKSGDDVFIK